MALFSSTISDYLAQATAAGTLPVGVTSTLPDNTVDWTIFCWVQIANPPTVNVNDYKVVWTCYTVGTDYTQPYLGLFIEQHDGPQTILMYGDAGSGLQNTPNVPITVGTWVACGVTYDATTHVVTCYLGSQIGTSVVLTSAGTMNLDFSSSPFVDLSAMGDDTGNAIPGIAITTWRLWLGSKLTIPQLQAEAQSTLARLSTNLETDTPLLDVADILDLTANQNDWTIIGTVTPLFPGPYTAVPRKLVVCPEGGNIYFADVNGHVQVIAPLDSAAPHIVTVAAMRNGHYWACDNSAGTHSALHEIDPSDGSTVRSVTCTALIGQSQGAHCLMELPNGNVLAAIQTGPPCGPLVEVSTVDGSTVTTYSLTGFDPIFDAAINADGTRLLYLEGQQYLRVWDLTTDSLAGTIYDYGSAGLWWPIWLSDGSVLLSAGSFLGDGNILRVGLDGTLIYTYIYDNAIFDEGQYGIAASLGENSLWIVGDWDDAGGTSGSYEAPGVIRLSLVPGGQINFQNMPGVSTDFDVVAAVLSPWSAPAITPFPPAPVTTVYPVRRLRRFNGPFNQNFIQQVSRLEILCQPGIGTTTGSTVLPTLMLRVSKDGGQTWSQYLEGSPGPLGDYLKRVYWNMLGQGRNWVFELSCSDPVAWAFVDAYITGEQGTS